MSDTENTGEAWAYEIAHEDDETTRMALHARTGTGEDVMLLFATRAAAETYCREHQVSRPWPIDPLTKVETLALLYAAQMEGTRWVSDGTRGMRDLGLFLAAAESQADLPVLYGD